MLSEYSDFWRGPCCKHQIIQENFLLIGYHAWKGCCSSGRGVVVCESETSSGKMAFTSPSQTRVLFLGVPSFASLFLEFDLNRDAVLQLLQATEVYKPEQELVLMTIIDQHLEINWLKNLAIAPPDCFQQVCHRWEEFHFD